MKRFKIVIKNIAHYANIVIRSLPLRIYASYKTNSLSIRSNISKVFLRKARQLMDMDSDGVDNLTLKEFDEMILDNIDYVPY